MFRTHDCGELRIENNGQMVTLSGWVAKRRDFGALSFIDLRDRYGITQLSFNEAYNKELLDEARKMGREFVLQVQGKVTERSNKNPKLSTGDVEVVVESMRILNPSLTPPFTIEDDTDGGDHSIDGDVLGFAGRFDGHGDRVGAGELVAHRQHDREAL